MNLVSGQTVKPKTRRLCPKCKQPMTILDDNLLKSSIRVLSSLATSLQPAVNNQNQPCENCAQQQPPSTLIKMPVIEKNENLHNCQARHTNSRKREYRRWDIPHAVLVARYRPKPIFRQYAVITRLGVLVSDNAGNDEIDSESSSYSDQTWNDLPERQDDLATERDDEDLDESERLQLNVDKIRKQNSAAMLREIQVIKERHKTLAEFTQSRNRVKGEDKPSYSYEKITAEVNSARHDLRRLKKHQSIFEKDEKFQRFREKTTVRTNRKFRKPVNKEDQIGLLYIQKDLTHLSSHKSKPNSLHPVSDAMQKIQPKPFKTLKPGDMQPSVYFPVVCEAKTAVESALKLDKFIKYLEREGTQCSLVSMTNA